MALSDIFQNWTIAKLGSSEPRPSLADGQAVRGRGLRKKKNEKYTFVNSFLSMFTAKAGWVIVISEPFLRRSMP